MYVDFLSLKTHYKWRNNYSLVDNKQSIFDQKFHSELLHHLGKCFLTWAGTTLPGQVLYYLSRCYITWAGCYIAWSGVTLPVQVLYYLIRCYITIQVLYYLIRCYFTWAHWTIWGRSSSSRKASNCCLAPSLDNSWRRPPVTHLKKLYQIISQVKTKIHNDFRKHLLILMFTAKIKMRQLPLRQMYSSKNRL